MDERRVRATVDALSSGTIRHPRFTKQEVKASNGTEHGKFWNIILSLEPADVHAGGGAFGSSRSGGNGSRGGKGLGLVRELATRYGRSPVEVVGERRKYLDGGVESKVFLNENGRVVKVRRLSAYSVDGVVGELAKIAYHNYLFPKDAYTLVDLAVHENGGYDEYYLVLEQPFVTPLTVVGVRASTYDRKAYENAVNPFLGALGEYESIEEDDGLDEPERERLLANIRATNPLMRDGVREDVAAAVRQICKSEARARRAEKAGLEPDSALLSEIARGKSELLEKIRAERWK